MQILHMVVSTMATKLLQQKTGQGKDISPYPESNIGVRVPKIPFSMDVPDCFFASQPKRM
jgi:hypothetical protein